MAIQADAAEEALRTALQAEVTPDTLDHLGSVLLNANALEAALRAYEAAVANEPTLARLRICTGISLQLQLPARALYAAEHALALDPENADSWFNLGFVHAAAGRPKRAEAHYREVLQRSPAHYGAMRNLPLALMQTGQTSAAIQSALQAAQVFPQDAWIGANLGDLLMGEGMHLEARQAFQQVLDLAPDFGPARCGLATALAAVGEIEAAYQQWELAEQTTPESVATYTVPLALNSPHYGLPTLERVAMTTFHDQLQVCDWSAYQQQLALFVSLCKGEKGKHPLDSPEMPRLSLLLPVPQETRLQLAQRTARRWGAHQPSHLIRQKNRRKADQQLTIGYLSPDFGPHPTAWLLESLWALHDARYFRIHAYAVGPDNTSPERAKVVGNVAVFRAFEARMPAQAIAQAIANDGVDILVDLAGYTLHSRPDVLAFRPAPIQVSYLGYMGTTGSPAIDYALLDHTVMTPAQRSAWTEQIAYLPDTSFMCSLENMTLSAETSQAQLPQAAEQVLLGAMHAANKISPASFNAWMEIIRQSPKATLVMLEHHPEQADNLRRHAAEQGVPPERLHFLPRLPRAQHLAVHLQLDLVLDTFIYNGHTTTIEALAHGCPVITMPGEQVASRVAASLLAAHGVSELVVEGEADYIAKAVQLCNTPKALQVLRSKVLEGQSTGRLFRPEIRVREIESAYRTMWERHMAGLPPGDFDVPPVA